MEFIASLSEWGYLGLFIAAFLAGSIIPFSSEAVLGLLLIAGYDSWGCIISATKATAANRAPPGRRAGRGCPASTAAARCGLPCRTRRRRRPRSTSAAPRAYRERRVSRGRRGRQAFRASRACRVRPDRRERAARPAREQEIQRQPACDNDDQRHVPADKVCDFLQCLHTFSPSFPAIPGCFITALPAKSVRLGASFLYDRK